MQANDPIIIQNDGPRIRMTNYFESEYARNGFYYLSINAGAFRLLVPDRQLSEIEEWKTAREVIVSRGPWPQHNRTDIVEILFEDDSDTPYIIHIGTEQIDWMPSDADQDVAGTPPRWRFAVLTKAGKVMDLPCRYRHVDHVPWMKPFEQ